MRSLCSFLGEIHFNAALPPIIDTDMSYTSIVEINVAIIVACMPACASCLRHLYSYLQSLIKARSSHVNSTGETAKKENSKNTQGLHEPRQHFKPRYWRLRDWHRSNGGPPQITSVKGQSGLGYTFDDLHPSDATSVLGTRAPSPEDSTTTLEPDQQPVKRDNIV